MKDWKKGECDLIPGKTAPHLIPVERDYPAILIMSLLMLQCALGLLTIPFSAQHMDGSEMMKLVGWAQSVVTFHVGASAHLDGVAFIYRVHLVLGMTLFVLFPFSRLVHIWSAPVEYLTRKYQIVRARR